MGNTIHLINRYPVNKSLTKQTTQSTRGDLSTGVTHHLNNWSCIYKVIYTLYVEYTNEATIHEQDLQVLTKVISVS